MANTSVQEKIFQLRDEGKSYKEIGALLTDAGFKGPRGGPINTSFVHSTISKSGGAVKKKRQVKKRTAKINKTYNKSSEINNPADFQKFLLNVNGIETNTRLELLRAFNDLMTS